MAVKVSGSATLGSGASLRPRAAAGRQLTAAIVEALPVGVYLVNARGRVVCCNRAAAALLGKPSSPGVRLETFAECYGIYRAGTDALYPTAHLPLAAALAGCARDADDLELRSGEHSWRLRMRAVPLRDATERVQFALATVSESTPAPAAQPSASGEPARGARHLEALGELTAGVAHELNTPMQFIGDNTAFLGATVRRLLGLADSFERLVADCGKGAALDAETLRRYEHELSRARLPFLREQAPAAVEQALAGVEQVRMIVQALKDFSHPGADQAVLIDVNHLVRMASTVSRNAWRYNAELALDLCADPPPVRGHPQEIGQVLINLIVNAAHAIEERRGPDSLGNIQLRTRALPEGLEISIQDDGAGIPEAIRDRIMQPFFTTKPIGKGTGQGLALAHRAIVEHHRGQLSFESAVGVGTTFRILLPTAREP